MSWLYLPVSAEECLAPDSSASAPFALSSATRTPFPCSCRGSETAVSGPSQFGMTCAHSTVCRGEGALSSFLAGFPAKPTALPLLDKTSLMIFGRRCGASWQMSLPGTCSPRTLAGGQSKQRPKTVGLWVTKPARYPLARQTWVATTLGPGIGYLHTPTTKANYSAASMQKWPAARAFVQVFGRPSPSNQEWMMGYPAGWTDTAPLATDRFQSWRRLHFTPSLSASDSAA